MGYKLADGSDSEQYKIGDEFEVVCDKYHGFDVGEVIKLESLKGCDCPNFYGYCSDSNVYASQSVKWQEIKPHRNPFTKSDLKDGMRVELAKGCMLYVTGGIIQADRSDENYYEFYSLDRYRQALSHKRHSYLHIVRVTDRDGTIVFEREPEKRKITIELTDEQIESLKQQGIID